MRRWFIPVLLLICTAVQAQKGNTGVKHNFQNTDSVRKKMTAFTDSLKRASQPDTATVRSTDQTQINALLDLQKEQRARQKRSAMIRIALGVGFLVLLIFGLLRKKRK